VPISTRFKIIVALWFVVQITLPFTAPLQTVDLRDFFGHHSHHQAIQLTPESCAVPTTARRPAMVAPLTATTISTAAPALTLSRALRHPWPRTSPLGFATSPRLQQTVLRI
jgi:hypothetical protein